MKAGESLQLVAFAAVALAPASAVHAVVIEFTDRGAWFDAVNQVTTIGFTEFPHGTFITDQYSELGVLFTDGTDVVGCCSDVVFPEDGAGLNGVGSTSLSFDRPQAWIGVDFPGALRIELFSEGLLIYTSINFGGGGVGHFGGLVFSERFDAAVLSDFLDGSLFIDDLHFGPPVCTADIDEDGNVGIIDFLALLAAWGPAPGHPADFDGDGVVGILDFLLLLANWGPCSFFVDCNGNGVWDLIDLNNGTSPDCNSNAAPDECDLADGTSQDCNGNGVPDECGEDCNGNGIADECDVADGTSPDFNGNGIPDECDPVPNDVCENAMVISNGATPVVTGGATTESFAATCEGGVELFVNDIWFMYTAPCTGIATFSLCNDADFDTVLAIYFAGNCPPPLNPLACNDNAAGCGLTSEVQQPVLAGLSYLVRIGGKEGGGVGILTVSCEP